MKGHLFAPARSWGALEEADEFFELVIDEVDVEFDGFEVVAVARGEEYIAHCVLDPDYLHGFIVEDGV